MRKQALILVFSALAAFGLLCGLLYCIDQDLNSDSVVPGLVAMELFKHGNIQFTYPADDPYLFTDIVPFYLVTQLLSGYNPLVLKLTAYAIFLLTVTVFAYIVYRYSGTVSALIFTALFVNLNPATYTVFITPEYHVGTLLAAGVMIFAFDFDKVKDISIYRMLAYAIFAAMIVFSDSLIIVIFLVPYAACYLLYRLNKLMKPGPGLREKNAQNVEAARGFHGIVNADIMMALLIIMSGIAWLFKTYEPESLYQYIGLISHMTTNSGTAGSSPLNIYVQDLTFLVSQGLYGIFTAPVSLLEIAAAIIFLTVLAYSVIYRNKRANYLYAMALFSGAAMFLAFVFLDRAIDLWSARFLELTAVTIFMVIALAYNEESRHKVKNISFNTIFLAAVVILVLTTIPANLQKIASLDYQPNKAEYDLIGYLEANNIDRAYSDYWHSNILTYLSDEKLQIRAVEVNTGQPRIMLFTWLGSERWYKTIYANPVVIADKDDGFYSGMEAVISHYPDNLPKKVTYYNDYVIYSLFILG